MAILQSLLGGGSQKLIGLDISSSSVKLLELSRKGNRYHVEGYAIEALPPNAVTDKQITDPKLVGEAIARAVNRAGTRTRQAAVAVAGASVITKIIEMPASLSDDDMEEQIKAEADQFIPYPIDEVSLDFQVLGVSPKNAEMLDVMLAACRKEQVEQRCAAADLAGLTVKVVDIEAQALENACQFLQHQMPDGGHGKTIAIVDMGATTTSVLVLHDLQSVYTRDQAFGGRQLTEDIMRTYQMSFEDATKAKRSGVLPQGYETEVLEHFVSDMAQQIDRSLQFFFSAATRYNSIDQIILAGGCAHIPGVEARIQERLQIPTVIAHPFSTMSVASKAKPSTLAQDESSLLIACGLAWRAFDQDDA
ncbi:pilus assembly protein PilM [Sinimarinibacterium sp. CAU 1509]|uniref:pilus assembly protein PilM n=1 Tax=Sinimarinibacterium sp. CAU 1509 TaxID=2562283 RepID=UPI0010AD37DA|nr:pilus assembly protein PilM [Sinimarinibacterium sp. CAU 1509]TJY58337.1 pilus assembly protein PilM [Sinimarinibacterium sp. CAU 1509]